jgi:peptidoglycan/xylan/chitin deacetylase (PgdA/CDA1 family)
MSIKSFAEHAAHALGAVSLVRRKNRDSVRILMYHRFPSDLARLTSQCEHLSRHYHPVSLAEIADSAGKGRGLPPNSLAITVDDGFRDFAPAFAIFRRFGLKVTLYVVSGFAAGELWLWPDQLLYLLEKSRLRKVEIPVPGGAEVLDISNPAAAFDSFCQTMIRMKNQERLDTLARLPGLLEAELPRSVPERFAALSWVELKDLAAQGLDIGAHTMNHPILSSLESDAAIEREIAGSKARIEAEIGTAVTNFCYPNGKLADVNAAAVRAVAKAGYRTAVLAESGLARPPFDLFQLKRIGVEPDLSPLYFERCVAGYRL